MKTLWSRTSGCLLVAAVVATGAFGAELPETGAEAPDFTLETLGGGARTLSERRGEGPVVLIFFRGVW